MHFQTTVPNWPTSLLKMPDYTLVKAVIDGAILREAYNHWTAAGRDPDKLFLDLRYVDMDYTFSTDWNEMVLKWRKNFRMFIDGTYLSQYAPYIKLVEELNEYTDTRMVTDESLKQPRLVSAQAAVHVWNNEYRGRTLEIDGHVGTIPADARLVINNCPIGNDIPIEWFQLAVNEDCVLGYHPYTYWTRVDGVPIRATNDWYDLSGRWEKMEQEYGIKPVWAFTECGPFESVFTGWRHSKCLNGDENALVNAMREWVLDIQPTAAYQEGRILGPGAWFTSSTSNPEWKHYYLWESQLSKLADLMMGLWRPGQPVEPPPDDSEVGYVVVTNLLSQNAVLEEKHYVVDEVHESKETILQSADDAARLVAPGKPGSKVVVWEPSRWQDDIDVWLREHGVELIEHRTFPFEIKSYSVFGSVDDLPKHDTLTYRTRILTDITTLVVHHTVSSPDRSIASIAAYHVSPRPKAPEGWPGIGYHFVIKDNGDIYQTNYLETESYHTGTYAPGNENLYSVGIALQGDFTNDPPPQAQLDAAKWLVADLKDRLDITDVVGHRDMPEAQTQCPGNTSDLWFDYVAG